MQQESPRIGEKTNVVTAYPKKMVKEEMNGGNRSRRKRTEIILVKTNE